MATRTVRPAGGDYTSLSAWDAGRQADLTGLGPEIAECSGNLSDTAQCVVDGWTTTAADYIQIITPQADRHAGVWSASKYRLEVDQVFNRVLRILEDFVRVEGLQIRNTNTTADGYSCISYSDTTNNSAVGLVDACIIRNSATSASQGHGVHVLNTQGSYTVRNCIIYAAGGAALNLGIAFSGTRSSFVDNCTCIGATYGITQSADDTMTVRNTYAHGGTDAYTGTMTRTDCSHSSATVFAGSTASIAHSTANFVNVTATTEDYHLVSGASATLLTGGADLSGSFTLDIDGQTRSNWSIGADEFVAVAGILLAWFRA